MISKQQMRAAALQAYEGQRCPLYALQSTGNIVYGLSTAAAAASKDAYFIGEKATAAALQQLATLAEQLENEAEQQGGVFSGKVIGKL